MRLWGMNISDYYRLQFQKAIDKIADSIQRELKEMKPTCCKDAEVIENTAMGKSFFVCRGCKQEVFLPQPISIDTAEPLNGAVDLAYPVAAHLAPLPTPLPQSYSHIYTFVDSSRVSVCMNCGASYPTATPRCPGFAAMPPAP